MSDARDRLLSALLHKYRTILHLREASATQSTADARHIMRMLAARMPGSLQELQRLPIEVIRVRLSSLERALAGSATPEMWMRLQGAYHGQLRAGLRIRQLLRASGRPHGALELSLLGYVAAHDEPSPQSFHAASLAELVGPARGQLHEWAVERVAAEHAVPAEEVRRALLPA